MQRWLSEAWYNGSWFCRLLLPLSGLYHLLAQRQRTALLRARWQAGVPVIVVGNITAGGTGKTPVCLALAQHFTAQGKRVVLVSRGYGGHAAHYPLVVTADSDPAEAGDEAVLLARQSGCPVVVDPQRVRAAQLAEQQLQAQLIISDDGLQHYALARTVEIAVIDGKRGVGNGWLLPAGPLREPVSRLQTVDFVLVNGPWQQALAVPAGKQVTMQLQAKDLVNLQTGERLSPALWLQRHPAPKPVHAVAGIGNPARFYTSLQQLGFVIMPHAFADHHAYRASDLAFGDAVPVVMTAKDAVKCRRFAQAHWWALEVEAELPAGFWASLAVKISAQGL